MGELKRATLNNVLSVVPPFEGRVEVVNPKQQSSHQIVSEVLESHEIFSSHYDAIIREISFPKNDIERALFNFCKDNLHYVAEDDFQTSRSPAGILELGSREGVGVDCKHYAGFIAGVLSAKNRYYGKRYYKWKYRFASYDDNKQPGHVFVVVDTPDGEIWVDPVLHFLDQRWPRPVSFTDKIIDDMPIMRVSGAKHKCGCSGNCHCGNGRLGATATGQQKIETAGSSIEALGVVVGAATSETVVGVAVGALIVAVGALVTVAGKVFGSTWTENNEVRWLTAFYEYWVLGNASVTSDNHINEADTPSAIKWFTLVLGVPVFTRASFAALCGVDETTWKTQNFTDERKVANYLTFPEAVGVSYDQAMQAVQVAKGMSTVPAVPGKWATFPVAPAVIVQTTTSTTQNIPANSSAGMPQLTTAGEQAAVASNPINTAVSWIQANPLPSLAIAAIGGVILYEIFKKH